MTTELEPPAPLPIHSRAGWFNAGHTSGAIFAAKLMQSAEPLSQLEQKMDAYEFFHQIVDQIVKTHCAERYCIVKHRP